MGIDQYSKYLSESRRLFEELFIVRNYTSVLSPVYTTAPNSTELDKRFNVKILLTYARLLDVNAPEQQIGMALEYRMKWLDSRLQWIPDDYSGVKSIFVNRNLVWIPENTIYDTKTINDIPAEYQHTVQISSTGHVVLLRNVHLEVACRLKFGRFPFDEQQCGVVFNALTYSSSEVSMTASLSTNVDLSFYVGNGEFAVMNISIVKRVFGEIQKLDELGFVFHLRRNAHFYIYVVVVPCFGLTVLSTIGLFWTKNVKSEQINKLGVGLTSLMSMSVLLNMVSTMIPRSPVFPLLGVYVIICIGLSSISCVILVTMRAEDPKQKPPTTKAVSVPYRLWNTLKTPNKLLLIVFELAASINFIVFISFWRYDEKWKNYTHQWSK